MRRTATARTRPNEPGLGLTETKANTVTAISGLSHTAYDLLRIGAWALVIFGVLLMIVGLIGYWTPRRKLV